MHGFRRYVTLLLALAGLTLTVAGCGGGGVLSGGGTTTYTNDQYGFSLTYDKQFSQGDPVEGASAGGSPVLDIVFADKGGTIVSNRYVDAMEILVYEMAREVKPAEVPELKAEVQSVVDELLTSAPSAEVVEPLAKVTVNGLPGFSFKYTYTEGGAELTAVTYFLFKGKYEYEITTQATSANWDALKGKLEAAVQSFTVK